MDELTIRSQRSRRRRRIALAVAGAITAAAGGAAWAAAGGDTDASATGVGTSTTLAADGQSRHDGAHDHDAHTTTDAAAPADDPGHGSHDGSGVEGAGDAVESCLVAGADVAGNGGDTGAHSGHGLVIHDSSAGEPTAQDCTGAQQFYDAVAAASARYADIDAATTQGYVLTRQSADDQSPIDHYMLAGGNPDVLDPDRPEGLVYRVDGEGATLLGVVFVETDDADLVQPGGPFTTWHDHTASGCPAESPDCGQLGGSPPKMLHVWLFPGVADPFAHDYPQAVGAAGLG